MMTTWPSPFLNSPHNGRSERSRSRRHAAANGAPPRGIVLDMDSSVSPTHGEQESSVWNGHYECTCYHPLFVFNQFGDLERCALRPANVHSADEWDAVLKLVVARYQGKVSRIYFRADAAFAMPGVYEFLETERIKYAIRLPANQILHHRAPVLRKDRKSANVHAKSGFIWGIPAKQTSGRKS
jgi:hypothetical protein